MLACEADTKDTKIYKCIIKYWVFNYRVNYTMLTNGRKRHRDTKLPEKMAQIFDQNPKQASQIESNRSLH